MVRERMWGINRMNKITTIIGLSFAVFFLIGLATTLTRSMMIKLEGFRKNWKKISDKREVKITITIFIIKSLKTKLYILNTFKNSMGTNKTNNAIQNRIKNQNKPWAFHVITDLWTSPTDSSKR